MGGVIGLSLFQVNRVADFKATIRDLNEDKKLLKYQLEKSYKRGKPAPRKRNWKRKPRKK